MQIHMLKVCNSRMGGGEGGGGGERGKRERERERGYHVKTACQMISRMLINDQFLEEAESI